MPTYLYVQIVIALFSWKALVYPLRGGALIGRSGYLLPFRHQLVRQMRNNDELPGSNPSRQILLINLIRTQLISQSQPPINVVGGRSKFIVSKLTQV